MPGNFARGFFEATLSQQTNLVSRVEATLSQQTNLVSRVTQVENDSIIQIRHDSIIRVSSGETVEARVIHDVPNPNENYTVYLSDVTSLDGINIETNNGPTTVIRIINPNSHTVALKSHDAYPDNQNSPTVQILSSALASGALPAVSDFSNLTTSITTTNETILCRLFQTSGTKAWALIDS